MSLRPLRNLKNQNSNVQKENLPRVPKKVIGTRGLKVNGKDKSTALVNNKRKADSENCGKDKVAKKRSAFGDITNALEKTLLLNRKNEKNVEKESNNSKIAKSQDYSACQTEKKILKESHTEKNEVSFNATNNKSRAKESIPPRDNSRVVKAVESSNKEENVEDSILILSEELNNINKFVHEESCVYITASEGSPLEKSSLSAHSRGKFGIDHPGPPPGVEDYDSTNKGDPYSVSLYAMDVFNYYKERESNFVMGKYISKQPDITKSMRAILVDWMVEVQESFELNHETLYLAVKFVDLYLTKVVISRDKLQLVGSTAIFVACKFDERLPPYIDDFLYICDNAYKRRELILMEIEMLKSFNFDLGIPLSYRFLRRYSRCAQVGMETLTFARFILELSLMEYDFIEVRDSVLAAASLFLALNINEKLRTWTDTLKYYSGYDLDDIYHVVQMLHQMLTQQTKDHLKTIRTKYSHKIFFEVGKIPIPEHLEVDD